MQILHSSDMESSVAAVVDAPNYAAVVDKLEDFKEVDAATAEYREAGFNGPVFVMPVGGTDAAYFANSKHIADIALERGYRYSPRLHVDIWSNGWGK
jgi:7-carboxy-7-deazaguanine synthase